MTYNPAPAPGFEYDRFIRPADTYPRIVTVVPQTSAIAEIVAAGAGISILSRRALTPVIDSGRVVPIRCGQDGLPPPWVAVLRGEEPDASAARLIADLLAVRLAATLPPPGPDGVGGRPGEDG